MVVYHVEDYAHASIVQRLNKGLELKDTRNRVSSIGRVCTLRSVVVLRLITPVILVCGTRLIDRAEVGCGQEVNVCHTHLTEVVDTCSEILIRACAELSHGDILTGIAAASALMSGHIAVVHLIDNDLRRVNLGTLILAPALRVSVAHIDDSTTVTIYVECTSEDTSSLLEGLAINGDLEGVVHTLLIAIDLSAPKAIVALAHGNLLGESIAIVEAHNNTLSSGCPQLERCLCRGVVHLKDGLCRDITLIHLRLIVAGYECCHSNNSHALQKTFDCSHIVKF